MAKAHLYYATDTYCVWCWGFGPALRSFLAENAERLWIDVVPGGLLVGDRVVPVGQKVRVKESAARVAELCHVEFGQGFHDAVDEGSTILDSLVAARAFVALCAEAGAERGVEIAHALQHAWYWDGRDLGAPGVLESIAEGLGLNAARVRTGFEDPASTTAAEAEFQRRKDLQIKGYPSLLLETPEGLKQVGGPTSSAERLTYCFDKLMAGEVPEDDPADDEE